jgi:hypothetical protein
VGILLVVVSVCKYMFVEMWREREGKGRVLERERERLRF